MGRKRHIDAEDTCLEIRGRKCFDLIDQPQFLPDALIQPGRGGGAEDRHEQAHRKTAVVLRADAGHCECELRLLKILFAQCDTPVVGRCICGDRIARIGQGAKIFLA